MTNNINNIVTMIGILISASSLLVLACLHVKRFIFYVRSKRFSKKMLLFKNKNCYITLSTFMEKDTGHPYDYVTLKAVESYSKLMKYLINLDLKVKLLLDSSESSNVIHIGGPATNKNVNAILADNLEKIKYHCDESRREMFNKLPISQKYIIYNNQNINGFSFGEKMFYIDKDKLDIGIFIRIPYNEKKGSNSTIHIIFGAWDIGTKRAVEFFTQNSKLIAKKFGKNQYCFVVKISRINNSINSYTFDDLIDVSSAVFGNL